MTCDVESIECEHRPCLHGGTCVDKVNDFECQCVAGWQGPLCQHNFDDCAAVPCANGGQCHDLVNAFECVCTSGFGGRTCSVDINECLSQPCLNGGTCVDERNGYHCTCASGYHGTHCHLLLGQTDSATTPQMTSSSSHQSSTSPDNVGNTVSAPSTTPQNDVAAPQNKPVVIKDESMFSMQIALIVCLGVGLPLIIIIIVLFILLWRKRRHPPPRQNDQHVTGDDVDADNFRNAQIVRNNKLQAEHVPNVTSAPQPTTSRGGVITAHNNLKNNIVEKNYSKADVNTAVVRNNCLDARNLQQQAHSR